MKTLLLTLFFLASIDAKAQSQSQELFSKGFDNFYGTYDTERKEVVKELDTALFFLHKLEAQFPDYKRAVTQNIISMCYFEKKDYDKSLFYAEKVLATNKTNNLDATEYCLECNSACYRVGYIYQVQNEFEKALAYYDSCLFTYRVPSEFCSISHYLTTIPKDYDLFICYKGLGQGKKALAKLTPYMFDSTVNAFLDTTIVNDYVKLFSTLYSKSEIVNYIQIAMDSIRYDITTSKSEYDSKNKHKANCWIELFGKRIVLLDEITWYDGENEVDSIFSKENQIDKIKNSLGFRRLFVE